MTRCRSGDDDAIEDADDDAGGERDKEGGPNSHPTLGEEHDRHRPGRRTPRRRRVELACRHQERHAERDDAEFGKEGEGVETMARRQEIVVAGA